MHHDMAPSPIANRIGIGAVILLIAAFALSTMSVLLLPAGADAKFAAHRDDGNAEVVFLDDDDDDDDDDSTNSGRQARASGDSNSRSIGSRSANTRTGTTRGTGKSRSVSNSRGERSANTRTGTTRGTGKSRSVSNSS